MAYRIGFMCQGREQAWLAETAEEAYWIIDLLEGKLSAGDFLTMMMDAHPQWVTAATQLVNFCVTGA